METLSKNPNPSPAKRESTPEDDVRDIAREACQAAFETNDYLRQLHDVLKDIGSEAADELIDDLDNIIAAGDDLELAISRFDPRRLSEQASPDDLESDDSEPDEDE